jgi:hypothetical protein
VIAARYSNCPLSPSKNGLTSPVKRPGPHDKTHVCSANRPIPRVFPYWQRSCPGTEKLLKIFGEYWSNIYKNDYDETFCEDDFRNTE